MAMEVCGEEQQVKLIGASLHPFVLRVRIALALKGIDYHFIEDDAIEGMNYELIEENLQNKKQLLLQSNPLTVLMHNGKPVCDSMNIVEYIDDIWNTKAPVLMPKDPYDRANARFWCAFVKFEVMPWLGEVLMGQGEQRQKAVEELVANFLLLEETLRTSPGFLGKPYFGGAEIGFVDIALGGTAAFAKALQKVTNSVLIDEEKMPLLSGWMDRFCEADGVKEVMPDPVKMHEFISAKKVRFTSPPTAAAIWAFE